MEVDIKRFEKMEDCSKDARVEGDTYVNEVAASVVLTLRDSPRSGRPVATVFGERLCTWMMKGRGGREEKGRHDEGRDKERGSETHVGGYTKGW